MKQYKIQCIICQESIDLTLNTHKCSYRNTQCDIKIQTINTMSTPINLQKINRHN